jgi:hypothetical protein
MDGALKTGLDTDDFPRPSIAILLEVDIALHAGQVKTGNRAAVETPARIISRTERIVYYEVYAEDSALTQTAKRARPQLECLVQDCHLHLLTLCQCK